MTTELPHTNKLKLLPKLNYSRAILVLRNMATIIHHNYLTSETNKSRCEHEYELSTKLHKISQCVACIAATLTSPRLHLPAYRETQSDL